MQIVEQEIARRYPHLLTGIKAPITKAVLRGYSKFCRLNIIEKFIHNNATLNAKQFIQQALTDFKINYDVNPVNNSQIPATGKCIIVANHPTGISDALALLHMIMAIRPDVKILANDLLCALGVLNELIIPVNVFKNNRHRRNLSLVSDTLKANQCVVIFPAGQVSRLSMKGIKDLPWRTGFIKLAMSHEAPIIPVQITARNSALFYGASSLYRPLGTLLLPREVTKQSATKIQLCIGTAQTIDKTAPLTPSLASIRQNLYAIGKRNKFTSSKQEKLISAIDVAVVEHALMQMHRSVECSDGKIIYAGKIPKHSPLIREIGRLRELSFRAVGEGTGLAMDVDQFDAWYEHIILWDPDQREIAGAYRLAIGPHVYAQYGLDGFYSSSLFNYSCAFLPKLVQGAELGRSFVVPKHWNSRSLDNLWRGVGACLNQHPEIRFLFGPVSISADMPVAAREKMVAFFQTHYPDAQDLASAKNPFLFMQPTNSSAVLEKNWTVLKTELNELGTQIPTLYKQYTELCEPIGTRFLAFGIDPSFNNAVDGLILLDIQCMKPRKYARYFCSVSSDEITSAN